jgi:hypothetical protein
MKLIQTHPAPERKVKELSSTNCEAQGEQELNTANERDKRYHVRQALPPHSLLFFSPESEPGSSLILYFLDLRSW